MDQQRFDELTRAFAGGRSRRHILKLLGGLTAGAGVALAGRSVARAGEGCFDEGGECSVHEDCCGDLACLFGFCGDASICAGDGDPCGFAEPTSLSATVIVECCEGFVCSETSGTCEAEAPVCGEIGDDCAILNADLPACCGDLICDSETLTCVEATTDIPCETDDDCIAPASGNLPICCAGFCRDIECCIDDEDPNARCPEGTSCFEGICDPIVCGGEGDPCADSAECCGTLVCWESYCAVPVDDEDDPAPVTELPNTGSGTDADNAGGAGLIAGAALAAGAAAFLANKNRNARSAVNPSE